MPGVLGERVGTGVLHTRVVGVSAAQASAVDFGDEAPPPGDLVGSVGLGGCVARGYVVFLEPVGGPQSGDTMVSG